MERFNSGAGGYTCDGCNVLLWSGVGGGSGPSQRNYCYTPKSDKDIHQEGVGFYCMPCKEKMNEAID